MANEVSIGLAVEGEKQFKDALADISRQAKVLDSEMKAVTSSFDKTTTAEEKAQRAGEVYTKQVKNQQERIDLLTKELENAKELYGENSKEVDNLQIALNKANTVMNLQKKSFDDITTSAKDSGESVGTFWQVLRANVRANGLQFVLDTIKKIGRRAFDTVKGLARMADDLNTMRAKTGLSTETLQELTYASDLIDVSVDTIAGSLKKLTSNMNSAKNGTKATAQAFDKLGVSVTDSVTGELRDSEDVFYDVIDALGKIDNEAERDALSMQIFGKSATELNPLILQGSDALRGLRDEAHNVGYVLDQDTLNSMNAVNDNFDRMKLQSEALKNQLGVQLTPVIAEMQEWLMQVAQGIDWVAVGEIVKTVVAGVVNVIQVAIETITLLVNGIKAIVDGVQWVFDTLPQLWDGIVAQVVQVKDNIVNKFNELIDGAKQWGSDMIQGFIDGIKAKFDALKGSVINIANTIRSFLHFSRPDQGALRDYETWMPDFVAGLAKGIEANKYKVANAIEGLASTMVLSPSVATAGAYGSGSVINLGGITINGVADEAQINNMVNMIERKLGRRLYR